MLSANRKSRRKGQRTAIVTGGAGAIGKATVKKLLEEEYRITIVDKNSEKGRNFLEDLENDGYEEYERVIFLDLDLNDSLNAEKVSQTTIKHFERIDVLVNLAGNAFGEDILDIDDTTFEMDIKTNLYTAFSCTRATLPYMKKQGYGVIVNISSVNSLVGIGQVAYSAAKAGVNSLTKNTAVIYGRHGIRCNCICLGTIRAESPFWRKRLNEDPEVFDKISATIPRKKVGTPEEVANLISFLGSEDSALLNGAIIIADGGWTLAASTVGRKEGYWWEI
jgi:NAD(P)-dependent dehydrogenase (short-subunit alcohol dehydrogenase family)